jgi:hypothetical protein
MGQADINKVEKAVEEDFEVPFGEVCIGFLFRRRCVHWNWLSAYRERFQGDVKWRDGSQELKQTTKK